MKQNDLIQNILSVERKANALTEEAILRQENMDEAIEGEIQAIRERYDREADSYLQKFEQTQRAAHDRRMQELDARRIRKLRQVEDIYASHREEWVESIFRRIVGKAGG